MNILKIALVNFRYFLLCQLMTNLIFSESTMTTKALHIILHLIKMFIFRTVQKS